MSLLEIKNLTINYGSSAVVQNLSLSINAGESVALVGESGSGKSQTALSILRLLPANASISGQILFNGYNLAELPEAELRHIRGAKIAMIFQEPMTALNPLHSIERQIAEVLWLHEGLKPAAARPRVIDLLNLVGIPNPAERLSAYPHELSGGQRQRVMIAMALAGKPDLLIADEPTTALDVTIQAQILELLQNLQRQLGMALLLITHDLGIVKKMAARVAVMQAGQIVEHNTTAALFSAPQHEYTKLLLNSEPQGSAALLQATAPVLLQAENIKVHFPIKKGILQRTASHIKAVDNISLTVRAGETLGIVGESGSGKSTLAQALLGLTQFQGTVMLGTTNLGTLAPRAKRQIRQQIQIVFQDPFSSLAPRHTVADIILEGLRWHQPHITVADQQQRLAAIMNEVGLDPASAARYPHEFSGGQRQRIAIARALLLQPKLLVLDEPTSALDKTVQLQVLQLLKNLQAKHGMGYVLISHDLAVVKAMAHHVIVMQHGQVVESGSAQKIFSVPEAAYTKTLLAAALNKS